MFDVETCSRIRICVGEHENTPLVFNRVKVLLPVRFGAYARLESHERPILLPVLERTPDREKMTGATPIWDPLFHRNFGRLVLGCIDASDSERRRIFHHFSRSTRFAFRCTAKMTGI